MPTGVSDGFGTLTLDSALSYEVAEVNMNSTGSAMVIGEWTAFDATAEMVGLYAVRQVFADESVSDYTLAYAYGDLTERQNILDMNEAGTRIATCRDTNDSADTTLFYPAMWSGSVSPSGSLGSDTIFAHTQINLTPYAEAKATFDALSEGDAGYDEAKTKLDSETAKALDAADNIVYKYAFDREGVIKTNEAEKFTLRFFCNNSTFITKTLTTKFVAYVSDRSGNIKTYSKSYTQEYAGVSTSKSFSFSAVVTFSEFLPEDGFLVAFEYYPNTDNPADNLVEAGSGSFRYATWFKTNSYVIKAPAVQPADKPTLSLTTKNAVITVTNYNDSVTYAYSDDSGKTFTAFDGDSFNATKASHSYLVKSFGNDSYLESEVSDPITSPALTVVGTSLVLDGRIGLKIYMDVDTDILSDVYYYMTRVNNDYVCNEGDENYSLYRKGGSSSFNSSTAWSDKILYDAERELYYMIMYVSPKDVDNVRIESDIGGYPDNGNTRVSYGNLGGSVTVTAYIERAKAEALNGNEEFLKALDLITSLETYAKYSDNYFGKGDLEAYSSSDLSTATVTEPSKTAGSPEGLRFSSTSLILEDTVTIRHYFEKTDLDTYLLNYTCDIPYGEKGNYVYFDIENIPAQEYNTKQKLSIKHNEGDTYEINYSVANYIADMANDSDTRLVSLINSMYDYHLAAKDYLKPKPLYLSYDATLSHESAQGGLHIYIPTKDGYIDHTFVRTVSTDRNADVWRISRAYAVDDSLENPIQLTVDNAEWDMALKIVGRSDFIGGWMHGDEIYENIKFIIDGEEKDVTSLTEKISFEAMTIIENSTGYDPSDSSVAAFKHYKEFTVSHAGIRLDQKVEWLNDYDVEYSYLAMMPPKKEYTDSYYTNLDTVPKTIDYTNGQINESGATSVTVFGKESGYYFTMTVNEYDTYIKPLMSIADNGGGPYNKMYFGFVNKGSVVTGDVWETFTQYKIDKK
ncbi:MAG: hypothetical protein IJ323_06535 [Clostridia bacterium]|nr:hypothetical protein [Clostridia bacterium]